MSIALEPGIACCTVEPCLGALALLALLASACSRAGDSHAPRVPDVLLISIDTLRPDRLGCYGHARETSPTLDRLAASGVVFEDVTSAAPWTLPAHASLLTGLYPSRHGLKQQTRRLAADVPTLATTLAGAGYETAAVVNSHFVSERYGLDQGFERFQYVREILDDGSIPNRGPRVLRHARQVLADRGDRPLLLFLHFYDVHTDFVVGPSYRERFVAPYDGPLDGTTRQLSEIRAREAPLGEADLRFLFELYDAEIRQLDDLLGEFLGELERAGSLAHTLVAVVSDHGEEFMEHGSLLHGRTFYQEVIRIPWILSGPGVPAGVRIAPPVHLVDVLPTLLELAGVPPPAGAPLDGRSLVPLLAGGDDSGLADRVLFAEADHNNAQPDIRRLARTPTHKLLRDRLADTWVLFDLERDPLEVDDRLADEPELAALLRERLEAFLAGELEAEPIEGPSQAELEALRRLGY